MLPTFYKSATISVKNMQLNRPRSEIVLYIHV